MVKISKDWDKFSLFRHGYLVKRKKKDLKWQVTCLWGMSFEGQSDLTQKGYQGCVPLG